MSTKQGAFDDFWNKFQTHFDEQESHPRLDPDDVGMVRLLKNADTSEEIE